MDNHLILKLLCGYLSVRDIMCFSVLSKAMYGEEEEFYKYFFNAKKSMINEYWLDLFLNNVEINKYHIYDILNNFQNCILNNTVVKYKFKTLSLFYELNFIDFPTEQTSKLCQVVIQNGVGLLKSKSAMQVELQKLLNQYGRKKGDYYSCKNTLNNKIELYETRCKSLEVITRDISSHLKNIKRALNYKETNISWQDRCKRMKRSNSDLKNRFHEMKKINIDINNTAAHVDNKKNKVMMIDDKMSEIKHFMKYHQRIELLYLNTIQ